MGAPEQVYQEASVLHTGVEGGHRGGFSEIKILQSFEGFNNPRHKKSSRSFHSKSKSYVQMSEWLCDKIRKINRYLATFYPGETGVATW